MPRPGRFRQPPRYKELQQCLTDIEGFCLPFSFCVPHPRKWRKTTNCRAKPKLSAHSSASNRVADKACRRFEHIRSPGLVKGSSSRLPACFGIIPEYEGGTQHRLDAIDSGKFEPNVRRADIHEVSAVRPKSPPHRACGTVQSRSTSNLTKPAGLDAQWIPCGNCGRAARRFRLDRWRPAPYSLGKLAQPCVRKSLFERESRCDTPSSIPRGVLSVL